MWHAGIPVADKAVLWAASGRLIVFDAPCRVEAACDAGGTFIKRIVGPAG